MDGVKVGLCGCYGVLRTRLLMRHLDLTMRRAGDVATFTAAAGNSFSVIAYGGVWYAFNLQGVMLA